MKQISVSEVVFRRNIPVVFRYTYNNKMKYEYGLYKTFTKHVKTVTCFDCVDVDYKWIRALLVPMHLGLYTDPLYSII